MAAKRLVRKFTDVVAEVELQLKAHYDVSEAELTAWRNRANALAHKFPAEMAKPMKPFQN